MANIISVIQTKGGTGKTTTAMMVSFALSSLGDRVLVLDADKQRSAADWAEEADDDLGFEVLAVPTDRTLETAIRRFGNQDYDFILIDTPPGSSSIVSSNRSRLSTLTSVSGCLSLPRRHSRQISVLL